MWQGYFVQHRFSFSTFLNIFTHCLIWTATVQIATGMNIGQVMNICKFLVGILVASTKGQQISPSDQATFQVIRNVQLLEPTIVKTNKSTDAISCLSICLNVSIVQLYTTYYYICKEGKPIFKKVTRLCNKTTSTQKLENCLMYNCTLLITFIYYTLGS